MGVKISDLTAASAGGAAQEFEINDSGASKKLTGAQVKTFVNSDRAALGANSDITSLSGLTTALSLAQGGTGATSAGAARTALGLGTAATSASTDVDAAGTGLAMAIALG